VLVAVGFSLIVFVGLIVLLVVIVRGDASQTEPLQHQRQRRGTWRDNLVEHARISSALSASQALELDEDDLVGEAHARRGRALTPEIRAPPTMTYNIKLAVGFLQVLVKGILRKLLPGLLL
jgi:hypothetical protein